MPASRERILSALRAARVEGPALPETAGFGIRYDDPPRQFALAVAAAGGACVEVEGALEEALARLPVYASAQRVVSYVPGVARANVTLREPHDARDVDLCILPGDLGVAENGAVWVTNHGGRLRAATFLAQHLALVVSRGAIVSNLHEAYGRIRLVDFCLFISGPSKTADIEQALVIGAHGARSCTILLTRA